MNSLQSFGAEATKGVRSLAFFFRFLKFYFSVHAGELWLVSIWLTVLIGLFLVF